MSRSHFGGKAQGQSLSKKLGVSGQVALAFELRPIADRDALGPEYRAALVAFTENAANSVHIFDSRVMDDRTDLDQLLVPGFYLGTKDVRTVAIARQLQKFVFLLDDMVVLRDRAQISRQNSDYAAIEEPAALGGFAPDDSHFLGRENEDIQIPQI